MSFPMIQLDVLSSYLICGISSFMAAAMLRLTDRNDPRTRGALCHMMWGFLLLGLALTPAGLGAGAGQAVFQLWLSLGTLVAVVLVGRGASQIQGGRGDWISAGVLIALAVMASMSVLWIERLLFGRVFAVSLAVAATWLVWQARHLILTPRDTADRLFGLAMASLAPTVWVRVGTTFAYEGPVRADLMYAPAALSAFFSLQYSVLPMVVATLLLNVLNARLHLQLRSLASTDELTGLMTRRALRELAPVLIQHEQRRGREVALMMFDLDHFKRINDEFGHPMGDAVLAQAAQVLRANLRPDALLARFGGEEFVAVVPVQDLSVARSVAERLREAIVDVDWRDRLSLPNGATVSVGVAMLAPGEEMDLGLKRADEALYRAKRDGRNQCQVNLAAA